MVMKSGKATTMMNDTTMTRAQLAVLDSDGVVVVGETATTMMWRWRDTVVDALVPVPPAANEVAARPRRREARARPSRPTSGKGADDDAAPAWLTVNAIARRWSCSRAFVYRAIGEMERGGYLKRLYLGKSDQRIALTSVELWERLHSTPVGEPARRSEIVEMRERNIPRPAARRNAVAQTCGRPSLREAWKKLKGAGSN